MYRKTPGLGRVRRDPCLSPAVPSSRPSFPRQDQGMQVVFRAACVIALRRKGVAAIAAGGCKKQSHPPQSPFLRKGEDKRTNAAGCGSSGFPPPSTGRGGGLNREVQFP